MANDAILIQAKEEMIDYFYHEKKMDYIEITKNRSIIAIVNIISFFLPWISFDVSVKGELGADYSTSITGFGMISYSVFRFILYYATIIIIAIPFEGT